MVVWCGVVWCAVETVEWYAATPTMVGNRGLRGTQQAQNSTATGDIQHIETRTAGMTRIGIGITQDGMQMWGRCLTQVDRGRTQKALVWGKRQKSAWARETQGVAATAPEASIGCSPSTADELQEDDVEVGPAVQ